MVPNFPDDACKMWVTLLIVMLVRINVSSCAELHCVFLRNCEELVNRKRCESFWENCELGFYNIYRHIL